MSRRAAKLDLNHNDIMDALRAHGADVWSTASQGNGYPDALVGWRGTLILLEIKADKAKLTPREVKFFDIFGGRYPVYVVRSKAEALAVLDVEPVP